MMTLPIVHSVPNTLELGSAWILALWTLGLRLMSLPCVCVLMILQRCRLNVLLEFCTVSSPFPVAAGYIRGSSCSVNTSLDITALRATEVLDFPLFQKLCLF